jgi:hypothetical protein
MYVYKYKYIYMEINDLKQRYETLIGELDKMVVEVSKHTIFCICMFVYINMYIDIFTYMYILICMYIHMI